jgi:glycosyl transferase family 25
MQIYYLNLDHRTDRRTFIERELRLCGLEGERVAAVEPADLDPKLLEAQSRRPSGQALAATELACTMSHRKAWQRMLDRGLPHSLILEDDVRLSHLLPRFLADVPEALGPRNIVRIETRLIRGKTGRTARRIGEIELRPLLSAQWGTAGYIITADCARRILDHPGFFDMAMDHLFFDPAGPLFAEVDTLQCFPALCITGALLASGKPEVLWKSDIEPERRERFDSAKEAYPNRIRKLLREVKRLRRIVPRYYGMAAGFVSGDTSWRTAGFAGKDDIP